MVALLVLSCPCITTRSSPKRGDQGVIYRVNESPHFTAVVSSRPALSLLPPKFWNM